MLNKWVGGLIDRIFAVAGALLFAQLPMFILQYTQQLAGRAAELRLQLYSLDKIAKANGKTFQQYIQKFIDTNDPDFAQQGLLMENMGKRFTYLTNAEIDISSASALAKPFVFVQHFDWDIASTTFNYFQFGIPFSIEGLTYGLMGLGFGCLLFFAIKKTAALIAGRILWVKAQV